MLFRSLDCWVLWALTVTPSICIGQVELDVPVHFTGPTDTRTVSGVADPLDGNAGISYGAFAKGVHAWADAVPTQSGLSLAVAHSSGALAEGTLLRFIAPTTRYGTITLSINGAEQGLLKRMDGLDPINGDVVEGAILEVVLVGDGWSLTSPSIAGCPPTSFRVNARYCVDSLRAPTLMNMHDAMDYCAARGGKLCRWDEFYHACSTQAAAMNGLFSQWEWVDDTANHVHQGLQVARTSCMSQRSFSLNQLFAARCCYYNR